MSAIRGLRYKIKKNFRNEQHSCGALFRQNTKKTSPLANSKRRNINKGENWRGNKKSLSNRGWIDLYRSSRRLCYCAGAPCGGAGTPSGRPFGGCGGRCGRCFSTRKMRDNCSGFRESLNTRACSFLQAIISASALS